MGCRLRHMSTLRVKSSHPLAPMHTQLPINGIKGCSVNVGKSVFADSRSLSIKSYGCRFPRKSKGEYDAVKV